MSLTDEERRRIEEEERVRAEARVRAEVEARRKVEEEQRTLAAAGPRRPGRLSARRVGLYSAIALVAFAGILTVSLPRQALTPPRPGLPKSPAIATPGTSYPLTVGGRRELDEEQLKEISATLDSAACTTPGGCEVQGYRLQPVDVKGDGQLQYVVTLPKDYCGSGGCSTAFLMKRGDRWESVAEVFGWITVEESATKGVRDITLGYKHYLAQGGFEARGIPLVWDGTEYGLGTESRPADREARAEDQAGRPARAGEEAGREAGTREAEARGAKAGAAGQARGGPAEPEAEEEAKALASGDPAQRRAVVTRALAAAEQDEGRGDSGEAFRQYQRAWLVADRQEDAARWQRVNEAMERLYPKVPAKPPLPEELRRYRVQADVHYKAERLDEAIQAYRDALALAPWWAVGHYNLAVFLAREKRYQDAIEHMKWYLRLVPEAPNARAARDKIYAWETNAR